LRIAEIGYTHIYGFFLITQYVIRNTKSPFTESPLPSTPAIHHLTPAQIGEAIHVLGPALVDDPLTCYLFPDPARRLALFETTLIAHLTYGCLYGEVHITAAKDGVAIWLTPGQTDQSVWRLLRAGTVFLPLRFNWQTNRRLLHYINCADAQHARHAPDQHWYLYFLGVVPARQGQGVGGRLLREVLPRADAQHVACYLETSAERNVGYYQKYGFKVMSEAVLPNNGPRLWFMRREPG
jgi:predicted N-acetyltransferase YhbS